MISVPVLPDLPSPAHRLQKALWRQTVEVIRTSLQEAGSNLGTVAVAAGVRRSSAALVDRLSGTVVGVTHIADLMDSQVGRQHDTVVLLLDEGVQPVERVARVRSCLAKLHSTGLMIVLATVVSHPEAPPSQGRPGISQLIEELDLASGGTLYTEELRSVRWHGEPLVRGVVVTARYFRHGGHDES